MSERGKAISVLTANTLGVHGVFCRVDDERCIDHVPRRQRCLRLRQGPDGLVDRDPGAHRRHLPIACGHVDRSLWWPRGLRGGDAAHGGGGLSRQLRQRFLGFHRGRARLRACRHFVCRRHRLLLGVVSPAPTGHGARHFRSGQCRRCDHGDGRPIDPQRR